MRLFLFICLSEHRAHLPVDPLELTEVDFREILGSDVRKVPGRQEVRQDVYVFINQQAESGDDNYQSSHPSRRLVGQSEQRNRQLSVTSLPD